LKSSGAVKERLYAFDALRIAVVFLVVAGHAAIAYLSTGIAQIDWVVQDRAKSVIFHWMGPWIGAIAMPVFFFISGFWSAKQYEERGERVFFSDKLKRVLAPFLVACVVILPITLYVWALGWLMSGHCTLRNILMMKFEPGIQKNLFGPGHLWFLEYLFLASFLYVAVRRFWNFSLPESLVFSVLRPVFFALPGALILWLWPGAMLYFHNTFIPLPSRLVYCSIFFFAGAVVYRFKDRIHDFMRFDFLYLALSVPTFVWMVGYFWPYLTNDVASQNSALLSLSTSLYVWFSIFGWLGFFQRFFNKPSPAAHYLSDASYWTYLFHFPVVALFQIALYKVNFPAEGKFLIVLTSSIAVCLLFYEWLARQSSFGVYLGVSPRQNVSGAVSPRTLKAKIILTALLSVLILAFGFTYQFFYNREKEKYREVITGFYRKYFNREPDTIGLNHWTMMALNKWGLEKVEQEGFVEAKKKGAS